MKRPGEELFNLPPKLLSPNQILIRYLLKLHQCKQTVHGSNIIAVPHTSNPHTCHMYQLVILFSEWLVKPTIHLEDISVPPAGFSSPLIP